MVTTNKKSKKVMLILLVAIFFVNLKSSIAQVSINESYKNSPVWIQMMEDPNVNFFEANKAYETYWKYHKKPEGEEEEMEMMAALTGSKMTKKEQRKKEEIEREIKKEIEESTEKKYSQKEQLEISERENMKYQIKRFENWRLDVKPFVQEDGRILSEDEKKAIWMKQQEELKNSK